MLSLLKVNNAPLDFRWSVVHASVSMGGSTGDIKAFINVTGVDPSTEIHVNFGDNNSTINSSYTGFSWSGQLGTDYDNGTLEAEFTFSTENPVPSETDIKSHFMVKEDGSNL